MAHVKGWRAATEQALYGPDGFFTKHAPADHFRTSVTASPLFAGAMVRLVERVDAALAHPDRLDIVDIGAGRGELLLGLAAALPGEIRERSRFTAVELAGRPDDVPEWIGWTAKPPTGVVGLLLATEWLDNVPLDVAGVDEAGTRRLVLVDPETGEERLGGPPSAADDAWLDRWWRVEPGTRAEIGHTRDAAWASAVATVERGLALAVDYGHLAGGRPPDGTLSGYRQGRQVWPRPDGSCDVTAHVAIDAVAAAGAGVAGSAPTVLRQREALHRLGVSGARPPLSRAGTDPAGYLRALAAATEAAELTAPGGLGGHFWVLQPAGTAIEPLSVPTTSSAAPTSSDDQESYQK
jgi:SAM-dependent MidA family methyltransferase